MLSLGKLCQVAQIDDGEHLDSEKVLRDIERQSISASISFLAQGFTDTKLVIMCEYQLWMTD
jgi:hypothetical protein